MFDIGAWEILVILIIGLLVIGPDELPSVVRNIIKAIRSVKSTAHDLIQNLENETGIKQEIDELKEELSSSRQMMDQDGNLQTVYDISDLMPEFDVETMHKESTCLAEEIKDNQEKIYKNDERK